MKVLKSYSIFVLFLLIRSSKLAPLDTNNNTIFNLIKSDKRFEKLLQLDYVDECENGNTPICFALIDLIFHTNLTKVELPNDDIKDENFCASQLLKVLPDTPTAEDATTSLMKEYNITSWFKDTLNANDGKMCNDECTYKSYRDYKRKVKPVCFFIYHQYNNVIVLQKASLSTTATSLEQNQNKGK